MTNSFNWLRRVLDDYVKSEWITADQRRLAKETLLEILDITDLQMPFPALCSGEDHNFIMMWDTGRYYCDIEFLKDGEIEFWFRDRQNEKDNLFEEWDLERCGNAQTILDKLRYFYEDYKPDVEKSTNSTCPPTTNPD